MDPAKNELLTRVGPGTPMGELLRRYWHPIAGASELDENPVKAVRFFGEDLVLFRDLSGRYGLLDRYCPHRRADLSYGYVEKEGLRCNYHGWMMDDKGGCVEQPFEDTFNPEIAPCAKNCTSPGIPGARDGRACCGPTWARRPAPELPVWDPSPVEERLCRNRLRRQFRATGFSARKTSIDPVHFEWMHDNWGMRQRGEKGPYAAKHKKLELRTVRLWLHLQAHSRRRDRRRSTLEDRPRHALAERVLSRQPF